MTETRPDKGYDEAAERCCAGRGGRPRAWAAGCRAGGQASYGSASRPPRARPEGEGAAKAMCLRGPLVFARVGRQGIEP